MTEDIHPRSQGHPIQYQNDTGILRWVDGGYWHLKFNEGVIDTDKLLELTAFGAENTTGKAPLIIDRVNSYSFSDEDYRFNLDLAQSFLNCIAYVCYNPTSVGVSEYIRESLAGKIPVGIFSQLDEAVTWVKEHYVTKP